MQQVPEGLHRVVEPSGLLQGLRRLQPVGDVEEGDGHRGGACLLHPLQRCVEVTFHPPHDSVQVQPAKAHVGHDHVEVEDNVVVSTTAWLAGD